MMLPAVAHRLPTCAVGRNVGVEALPPKLIIYGCFAHGARPYGQIWLQRHQHAGITRRMYRLCQLERIRVVPTSAAAVTCGSYAWRYLACGRSTQANCDAGMLGRV